MIVYEVKKPIKHAGIGLERQPGQTVSDAELRSAPGWCDSLVEEGALAPMNTAPTKKAVKHAVS